MGESDAWGRVSRMAGGTNEPSGVGLRPSESGSEARVGESDAWGRARRMAGGTNESSFAGGSRRLETIGGGSFDSTRVFPPTSCASTTGAGVSETISNSGG